MINNLSPKLIHSQQTQIRTKEKKGRFMTNTSIKIYLNNSLELDERQNPSRIHFHKIIIETLNIPIKEPVYLLDDKVCNCINCKSGKPSDCMTIWRGKKSKTTKHPKFIILKLNFIEF
jgi:hypothetical protein